MPTEKDTFDAELDAILGELAVDTGEDGSTEAFSALSAELAGSEFEIAGETGLMSMLEIDGDPMMEELIFNVIKNRARRIVQDLIKLAKKYRNCPKCILLVTKTVALFKAGKYPQAIVFGIKAVDCFRTCAR